MSLERALAIDTRMSDLGMARRWPAPYRSRHMEDRVNGRSAHPGRASRRAEYLARLERVRGVLESRGHAAALLTARRNVAWLTAGAAGHIDQATEASVAAVLITRDDAMVITQNIEAARFGDEELIGLDLEVVPVPWWEPGAIQAEAQRRGGESTAVVGDAELESDLVRLRSVLSHFDRARLATLGREAAVAMEAAMAGAEPGHTEHELAAVLAGSLPGARVPVVLAAADERIARYRHPLSSDTPIRGRVMAVIVAERWGLHVALTRIREFDPPGADLAGRIEAVKTVQTAMHDRTRPGATFGDVFEAARSAYAAAGYPEEWRDHHQGGSIAYRAREAVATPGDPTVIEAGMAFAWNPSIAGAKAEDTIVIADESSPVVITAA